MNASQLWNRRWLPFAACLHWIAVTVTAATSQQSVFISKLKIHPAAERVFPNAQFSAPCAIITVDGLGPLDGDYTLLDDDFAVLGSQTKMAQRPAWIGASAYKVHLALSYQPEHRVWTIGGAYGLTNAFVQVDSRLPPTRSTMWSVFREGSSLFERVGNAVTISCPGKLRVAACTFPTLRILFQRRRTWESGFHEIMRLQLRIHGSFSSAQ